MVSEDAKRVLGCVSCFSASKEMNMTKTDALRPFCAYSLPYCANVLNLPQSEEYGSMESKGDCMLRFISSLPCYTH